ncbi:SdiA-regulated domain-containing protein [Lewinella sp. IMCC34191]|uniref:SdiA-regulated domain-containing protein n=1 Tax=Lewinella sp. IMCC34191 TaxID=2259172 RepID=UPI000E222D76|nr:SdiA-regulated domain-containing protein [Lewinella sp. IMCC34191]
MRFYLYTYLLAGLLYTCAPPPAFGQFTYQVQSPELLVELPDELEEISGLTLDGDDLLAIQDENGIIFRVSTVDGSIKERILFGDDGDYEGVALVGEDIWVAKSDGHLYQVTAAGQPDQEVTRHKTWLDQDYDVEGLYYDASNERLLLACKKDPPGNGMPKENRYVFSFDLATSQLAKEPAFTFPRYNKFSPSGLAIHPQSGDLYLTSSVGKQLAVVSTEGEIDMLINLPRKHFPQPEGICFDKDGTMYISSEARDGKPGRIYRLPLSPN